MEWSWTAWGISAAAVLASGAIAWFEGNWQRRPGLGMGFVDHGGMWGDLVLLAMANAAIVPHLTVGWWLPAAATASAMASAWVHRHWYGRGSDHLWPSGARGSWTRDLTWAGWAHVVYVAGELTLLAGFLTHPMPADVVIFAAALFTVHLPVALLQPRWFLTGHIATATEQPLLLPCLAAVWIATTMKLQ